MRYVFAIVLVISVALGLYFLSIALNPDAATPITTGPQLQELLTPVTGRELAEVTAKNAYFLKKHLYGAKRHRIVTADIDVLLSREPFVISLFNGDSLTLEPSHNQSYNTGLPIIWTGSISKPYISADQLRVRQHIGKKEAKLRHDAMFGVNIAASRYEYDIESGANFPTRALRSHSGNSSYYGMTANIFFPGAPGIYYLRPVDMGGPYHILVEIDPSKMITPGPLDDPENPERALKLRDLEEFLESLGEDPRRAIIREKRTE